MSELAQKIKPKNYLFYILIFFIVLLATSMMIIYTADKYKYALILFSIPIISTNIFFNKRIYLTLTTLLISAYIIVSYFVASNFMISVVIITMVGVSIVAISEIILLQKKKNEENQKLIFSNENRLKIAQEIAKVGHWELDLVKNKLSWSNEIYRIFNLEPQEFGATYEVFLSFIHPDDRQLVNDAYTNSVKNKTKYEITHRLLLPDGKIKWVIEKGKTSYGEDGNPLLSVGTVHDITKSKKTEFLLSAQYKLGMTLSEVKDLSETIKLCLDTAIKVSDMDSGGIYLFDDISGDLKIKHSINLSESFLETTTYFPADSPNVKLLLQKRKIFTNYEEVKIPVDESSKAEGLKALAIIPLIHNNNVIGALNLASHTFEEFESFSITAIEAISTQIAQIISNSMAEILLSESKDALLKSEKEYKNLFDNISNVYYKTNKDGELISINPSGIKLFGFNSIDEMKGLEVKDFYYDVDDRNAIMEELMLVGFIKNRNINLKNRNGDKIIAEFNSIALFDEDGNYNGIVGTFNNITEKVNIENKLKESEKRYRSLFENAADAIFIADVETGIINDVNNASEQLLQKSKTEIIGMHQSDLHPIEEVEQSKKTFEKHIEKASPQKLTGAVEHLVIRSDGVKVPVEISARQILINNKPVLQGFFRDITERKKTEIELNNHRTNLEKLVDERTIQLTDSNERLLKEIKEREEIEEKLQQSNSQLNSIFDTTPDYFILMDNQLVFQAVNAAFCKLVNKTEEELIGKTDFEIFPHEDAEIYRKSDLKVLSSGKKEVYESSIDNPDGSKKWFLVKKSPVFNSQNEITGLLVSINDFTERKQIENELKQHKDNLEKLVIVRTEQLQVRNEALNQEISERKLAEKSLRNREYQLKESQRVAQIGSYVMDLTTGNWEGSEMLDDIFGIDNNFSRDVSGWVQIVHPDDQTMMQQYFEKNVLNDNELFNKEYRIKRINDQKEYWVHGIGELEFNANGNPIRMIGTIQDITERKENEIKILKQTEAIEQSPSTVVITDLDGNIEYVNNSFVESTGYTKEEAIGQNPRILKSGNLSSELYSDLWGTITSGKTWRGEFLNKKKNRTLYWEEAIISPVKNEENKTINYIAIKTDITELKLLQLKLKKYNTELEERVAKKTKQFIASEENYRTLAETMDEYICRMDNDLNVIYANPSLLKIFGVDNIASLQEQTKLFSAKKIKHFMKDLGSIIDSGISQKYENKMPWGEWIEWHVVPQKIDKGKITGLIIVGHDITVRKETEEKMKDALEKEKELNKLKAQFVSTVSHEFRTPLTSIYSSIELVERYGEKWDHSKKQDHFNRIKTSIEHLTNMLEEMLLLSRTESGKIEFQPESIDLSKFCDSVIKDSIPLLSKEQSLNNSYNLSEEKYYIDRNLLRVILTNLISNAIKYSPNEGKINIDVSTQTDKIKFTIKDNGMGISETDMKHIFVPFYRSDEASTITGTGLGLSITKKYTELHKGILKVKSKLGEGSTFTLIIPKITNN